MRQMLYFDHAASTPIYPEVLDILKLSLEQDFANPSAAHRLGKKLNDQIDLLRLFFLDSLGADNKDHFYFTASATESNNSIIRGINFEASDIILYSLADHKSVVAPIQSWDKLGVELVALKHLSNGQIDHENLNFWIDQNKNKSVKLLVLSLINNQSGNIFDINNIAEKVKSAFSKVHIHIDAVQGYSKLPYKISKNIDSLCIASHKIGGPKSIAGLLIRKNKIIAPLLLGGGQQLGFRASTENYPLIQAMQKAAEISFKKSISSYEKAQVLELKIKDFFTVNIKNVIFPFEQTSPYIITLILPGIPSDVILRHLETKEVYLSSTSACSSRIKALNPTLEALNIPLKWHKHVLRISLSLDTSHYEVEQFLDVFLSLWNEIKYLSK